MADHVTPERLILLLAREGREPHEDAWIRRAAARIPDWPALYALADDNRVAPRVYAELRRLDLLGCVPAETRARFERESARILEDNQRRFTEGRPVLQALRDAGVDVILLKGAALAVSLYGDLGYKRMNDIDILVRKRDVRRVREVFESCGLIGIAERIADDPEKQLKVVHHLPPYINREGTLMFGTQWDFRSPRLGHVFDMDAVFDRSLPMTLEGVPVRRLAPEDNVHHICLHLERYKTGVRDLMDVHNALWQARDGFDWERFLERVRSSGTEDDTYYGLAFAHAHRPTFEVDDALAALRPHVSPFVRDLAAWRTRSPEVLLRVCSRQFAAIEKEVSALNATSVFREKFPLFFSAWGTILTPPLDDAMKICAYVDGTAWERAKSRLVAPWRLCQAIASEIGWLLLVGLMVKTSLDLTLSLNPLREGRSLDGYAAKLGMEPDKLRKVQEGVQ